MNNLMVNKPAVFISSFFFAGAAGLLLWPAPAESVPVITIENTDVQPGNTDSQHHDRIVELFNIEKLPEIKMDEAPPAIADPRAPVQKLTLLGITRNEEITIALLIDNGRQFTLRQGDEFNGFIVSNISARSINFVKDEISASLTLP